jgi:hypothetical protein
VGPLTPAEAQALATMNDRLKAYVDLHMKIERLLPPPADGGDARADRQKSARV